MHFAFVVAFAPFVDLGVETDFHEKGAGGGGAQEVAGWLTDATLAKWTGMKAPCVDCNCVSSGRMKSGKRWLAGNSSFRMAALRFAAGSR